MNEPNTSDAPGVSSPKSSSLSAAQASVEGEAEALASYFAQGVSPKNYGMIHASYKSKILASLLRVAQQKQPSVNVEELVQEAIGKLNPFGDGERVTLYNILSDLALRVAQAAQKHLLKPSVEVFVTRGNKVLGIKTNRYGGGFYGVGGKVEIGESFEDAARRELRQETGCEALSLRFVAGNVLDALPSDPEKGQWYCAGFVAEIGDQEPHKCEEHTEPFWTTREALMTESLFPSWYSWWIPLLSTLDEHSKAQAAQESGDTDSEGKEAVSDDVKAVLQNALELLPCARREIINLVLDGTRPDMIACVHARLEKLVKDVLSSHLTEEQGTPLGNSKSVVAQAVAQQDEKCDNCKGLGYTVTLWGPKCSKCDGSGQKQNLGEQEGQA